uniref:Uncharacterized protein n=1 Tax=Parascaris equorum TaxID=6256 RepID=A0A914R3E7_PAREQ
MENAHKGVCSLSGVVWLRSKQFWSPILSKLQEEKPAVNRRRRIRYRSKSSDSSRSGSRSPYYPSPLRLRRFHDESTDAEVKERRIQRAKRFGIQPPTGEYTVRDYLFSVWEKEEDV